MTTTTTTTASKLAYGYVRVSTREQGRSGLGLQSQRETIERFAHAEGFTVVQVVEEIQTGKGWDALDRRPLLAALLREAKKHKAPVIVSKVDRLSRNVAFGSAILESPVHFIAVEAGANADKFNLHIRMVLAEEERKRIADRTREAFAIARKRGRKLGNLKSLKVARTKGHATQKIQADAFALSTLPLVEAYQRQGLTLRQIADEMNKRGIPTARGGQWFASMLCLLISRAQYGTA